uniref:Transmembrane protein n=1 Tax=Caenorhabditis tropicalis TaxID=1561998 RepID=A0A1I7TV47_9PELO
MHLSHHVSESLIAASGPVKSSSRFCSIPSEDVSPPPTSSSSSSAFFVVSILSYGRLRILLVSTANLFFFPLVFVVRLLLFFPFSSGFCEKECMREKPVEEEEEKEEAVGSASRSTHSLLLSFSYARRQPVPPSASH